MNGLEALLASTVVLMVPLLLAALGEIIAERSGVLNLSIEGVMLAGCFGTALALSAGWGVGLASLAALPLGVLLGAGLAFLYLSRRVNQIVGGILVNLLSLALTTVLYVELLAEAADAATMPPIKVPLLHRLPVVGEAFFAQPLLVYTLVALVPLTHFLLFRTWFGLHCRAVGTRPAAVDSAGVSVHRIRGAALVIGSALIALGGAALVVLQAGSFTPGMTAGKGFIALAIVMVARWRPGLAVLAAGLCGLAEAFQFQARTLGLDQVPSEVWSMLPYIVTILAVLIGGSSRSPAALGENYVRAGH